MGLSIRSADSTPTAATAAYDGDDLFPARGVRLSDNHLMHMALEAAQSLNWAAVAQPPAAPHEWTAVKLKDPSISAATSTAAAAAAANSSAANNNNNGSNTGTPSTPLASRAAATSVFARQQGGHYVVVAHSVLPCSLHELALVLDAAASSDVMRVVHGDALVSTECVHRVETSATPARSEAATAAPGLAVTAVTFERKASGAKALFRPRRKSDDWCFLDFVQRTSPRVVRKTMLSVHPSELLAHAERPARSPGRDVLAGYLFEEQPDGRATRVAFWGEHALQQGGDGGALRRALANRAGKARLLRLAETVDRFMLVVRRRRLGAQVMADDVKVLASNSSCSCCGRSLLLARKRTCKLCGYFVCDRCSRDEERERRVRGSASDCSTGSGLGLDDARPRTELSRVRICDKCLVRVDLCSYQNVALDDLAPPRVRADPASPARRRGATTAAVLTDVLRSAIASSPASNRAPVLHIVQDLVALAGGADAPRSPLTDASSEEQHFAALRATLGDAPLPAPEACKLAHAECRGYAIEHGPDLGGTHPHPVPASEQRRLEIVRASRLTELGRVEELEIICAIVSAELGCLGVMISVSEAEAFHVVATNIAALPARSFPRSDGFCSRTIMGVDPMLVPHPEADVRFSYILPVTALGVSFYCGFPLFAEDFTVIGSMCCLGSASGTLSQSQFTVGKKLAETASRVLQRQIKLRSAAAATAASEAAPAPAPTAPVASVSAGVTLTTSATTHAPPATTAL